MKFTVSSKALYEGLNKISGLIGTNNIIAILDNCLLTVENNKLTLLSSDIENSMKIELEVDSNDKGAIAVPAKKIMDNLKFVPEQPLLVEVNLDNNTFKYKTNNAEYDYSGYSASEFPKIPEMNDTDSVSIKADSLVKAISSVSFALGVDEQRKAMTGMYCHFDQYGATFVATDAQRLAKYHRKDVSSSGTFHFILPKKVLGLLKSSLASSTSEVEISFNKNNAAFRFENLLVVCRLIDATFPEYNNVIPIDNPNKMTIGRETILNTLRRLSPLANQSTHQVNLKIQGSTLIASSQDLDFSNKGIEEHAVTYVGEDMSISFSSKYLSEVLTTLDTDDVTFELSTSNRAGLIFPVDQNEVESTMMLLMPILINIE